MRHAYGDMTHIYEASLQQDTPPDVCAGERKSVCVSVCVGGGGGAGGRGGLLLKGRGNQKKCESVVESSDGVYLKYGCDLFQHCVNNTESEPSSRQYTSNQ